MGGKTIHQYLKQIIRQSGIYFLGMVFTTVVGFFFKVYIARQLGASALGIYAMGLSIVALASGFSHIGLGSAGVRFISQYRTQKKWHFLRAYLQRTTLITAALGLVLSIAVYVLRYPISNSLFKKPEGATYMVYFALLIFLVSIQSVMQVFAQGFQNVGKQTIIGSFIKFPVKIVATIGLIAIGMGLSGYIIGEIVATLVSLVLFLILIWNLIPPQVKAIKEINKIPWDKNLLSLTGVFFGLKILAMFSSEIDKIVLGGFISPSDVGIYSVVLTLGGFIFILLSSLNSIFAPIIAEMYALDKHAELEKIYMATTRWILILSAPVAISLMTAGKSYLQIFGNEFTEGKFALLIVAIGYLVNVSYGPIGMIAQMTGLEKKLFRYQIITNIISISLFWILIPLWGLTGAAIAISVNNVFSNILISLIIKKNRGIYIITRQHLFLLGVFAATTLLGFYLNRILHFKDYLGEIVFSLALPVIIITGMVFSTGFLKTDLQTIVQTLLKNKVK